MATPRRHAMAGHPSTTRRANPRPKDRGLRAPVSKSAGQLVAQMPPGQLGGMPVRVPRVVGVQTYTRGALIATPFHRKDVAR